MTTSRSPFDDLARDWAALCAGPGVRARRRWVRQATVLAGVGRLEDLCCEDQARRARYFEGVLEVARTGDEVAMRALVQMLVPGLRTIARDLRRMLTRVEGYELDGDVITVAWSQVRASSTGASSLRTPCAMLRSIRRDTVRLQMRLEGRPMAENPLGKQRRVLSVGHEGELAEIERRFCPAEPAADIPAEACVARLSLDAAVGAGVLDRRAADIVWSVAVEDHMIEDAARLVGVSRSTAFRARVAAMASLRTHLEAA